MLVQVFKHLPYLGMLPLLAEGQGDCEPDRDGPLCGLGNHYLHRSQHHVHGHGALPNDGAV